MYEYQHCNWTLSKNQKLKEQHLISFWKLNLILLLRQSKFSDFSHFVKRCITQLDNNNSNRVRELRRTRIRTEPKNRDRRRRRQKRRHKEKTQKQDQVVQGNLFGQYDKMKFVGSQPYFCHMRQLDRQTDRQTG